MPVSSPIFDEEIELYFRHVPHACVADVGAGQGKFGKMIRRVQAKARLIGIEVDAGYVDEYGLRDIYDEVWVQDAAELMNQLDRSFSAIVIGDCIEHMRKSVGLDLINFLVYRSEIIIVKFPVGYVQNTWEGHRNEAHVSTWSEYDFRGLNYIFAEQEFMRLCFVRGWLSPTARWIPNALMERFGYRNLLEFFGDGRAVGMESVEDSGGRRVRGGGWSTEDSEAYRRDEAIEQIEGVIPVGDTFILVDEAEFGSKAVDGRCQVPFLEHRGQYWGPPPDDETAIRELERLRQGGASFMVFAWPAFWWLDYYAVLHRHLQSRFRCVLENERLKVFDIRP